MFTASLVTLATGIGTTAADYTTPHHAGLFATLIVIVDATAVLLASTP